MFRRMPCLQAVSTWVGLSSFIPHNIQNWWHWGSGFNFFWIKHDFSHLTVCKGIVITCRSENHMDQCWVRADVHAGPQSLVLNVDEQPRGKVLIPISHKLRLVAHLCLPRAGNLPTPPPGREILRRPAGVQLWKFCVNTAIMVSGVGKKIRCL